MAETNSIFNYPSPADVKIYIAGEWIDDAYRVDYSVQAPKQPLYDYTSSFFKDVAHGQSLVVGNLVLNYRMPNYLKFAIDQKLERDPSIMQALEETGGLVAYLTQAGSASDKVSRLLALKKTGSFKKAKQYANLLGGEIGGAPGRSSPLSISQVKQPGFDIEIAYGGEAAKNYRIIADCHITGESQVISASAVAGGDLSSSGMPIFETYSFIGRQLLVKINSAYQASVTQAKNFSEMRKAQGIEEPEGWTR